MMTLLNINLNLVTQNTIRDFIKKQIPKLVMSFGDDKIQSSVLGHGKSDSRPSRSSYIKLMQLKD
jgi:hypothetical protein